MWDLLRWPSLLWPQSPTCVRFAQMTIIINSLTHPLTWCLTCSDNDHYNGLTHRTIWCLTCSDDDHYHDFTHPLGLKYNQITNILLVLPTYLVWVSLRWPSLSWYHPPTWSVNPSDNHYRSLTHPLEVIFCSDDRHYYILTHIVWDWLRWSLSWFHISTWSETWWDNNNSHSLTHLLGVRLTQIAPSLSWCHQSFIIYDSGESGDPIQEDTFSSSWVVVWRWYLRRHLNNQYQTAHDNNLSICNGQHIYLT